MPYRTLGELTEHLRAYIGNDTAAHKVAAVKRAALSGLRNLLKYHSWAYYQAIYRIITVAPYSTGTVTYDHTGGASERLLTLAGGTWPDWAAFGSVRIANVNYDVQTRIDNTNVTLTATANPGADLAAGTVYQLYRDLYPMPDDFLGTDQPIVTGFGSGLCKMLPRDFVQARNWEEGPAEPRDYTFIGDVLKNGRINIGLHPPPDAIYQLEALYRRQPATPRLEDLSSGTVAVTSASAVVTGTGTEFTQRHVGTIFRLSIDGTPATPEDGLNPFVFESRIASVAGPLSITLEEAATETASARAYSVSDQVDVDPGVMWDFLLELCRKDLRIDTRMNMTNEELDGFNRARDAAKAGEGQRNSSREIAGWGRLLPGREYPTRTE